MGGAVITAGDRAWMPMVRAGFRRDGTHARLALLAWLMGLAVASVAVWPAWSWWSTVLAPAPRGDTMAQRVDLVVFKELIQFDRTSASGMLGAALTAAAVVALMLNPFLTGGVLAVLVRPHARFGASFFEHGARLYGRFWRTLVYVAVPAVMGVGLVSAGGQALTRVVAERGYERAAIVLTIVWMLAAIATAGFFTAVLDLARLRLLLLDSRQAFAAVVDAIRLAIRRLGTLLQVGVAFTALLLPLVVGMVWMRASLPGEGWGWLLMAVLLQQAAAYGRMRLRVAVMAAEVALASARWVAVSDAPDTPPSQLAASGTASGVDSVSQPC